jgi:hypothetical protein
VKYTFGLLSLVPGDSVFLYANELTDSWQCIRKDQDRIEGPGLATSREGKGMEGALITNGQWLINRAYTKKPSQNLQRTGFGALLDRGR